jgi:hypothetical protein
VQSFLDLAEEAEESRNHKDGAQVSQSTSFHQEKSKKRDRCQLIKNISSSKKKKGTSKKKPPKNSISEEQPRYKIQDPTH